ncbi:MAG: asparagine synthetase B, partial [Clostridia bacterium]
MEAIMCGIAGFIDYFEKRENKEEIIEKMIDTLKFRGPNTNGKFLDTFASLGHTRLAVVDVKNGLQPMIKYKGKKKYSIVYNGELYNTKELRDDLVEKGYVFQTNCDTEVLLTAYIEYGYKCPEKLNGIFAFAIWDGEELYLARDRFGVKP